MKKIFVDDLSRFSYFMEEKDRQKFKKIKIGMSLIPLLYLVYMMLNNNYDNLILVPVAMFGFSKLPYLYLCLVHNQYCNNVVDAIPLWVNQIYALIEKNTIHNAIVNSLNDNTPPVIKKDLERFVKKIEANSEDKEAYLEFLNHFNVSGFQEIMLKLFEFKNLSKDKLKDEIYALNKNLNKIEAQKRNNRFKSETLINDTLTCFIIFIPCMYFTVVSMMPVAM